MSNSTNGLKTTWDDVVGDDVPGFWKQAALGFFGVITMFSVARKLGWH